MTASTNQEATGPQVSLALGSGGARGYAHIGVIEELEARGYRIASIAGSSMGALIGGIHARGKLAEYRDWVLPLQRRDVFRMLDWTVSGGGFLKGNRIIEALRELIGDSLIEDLPIPFTAVAVDIDSQREIWFSSGPLFDAIRASIAVPTIFRPHHYQGRTLVDGGLLNPLPVSPTLRDRTDYIIAVNVNADADPRLTPPEEAEHSGTTARNLIDRLLPSHRESATPASSGYQRKLAEFLSGLHRKPGGHRNPEPELGLFDLFARSMDTVQETITRLKLAAQPPDLEIRIPRNACAFYEFHRATDLVELGRQRARESLDAWQRPVT